MRAAGVNLVTLGVFSWGRLEPREGEFDFGWLDRVLDLLHGAASGSTWRHRPPSPPIWLTRPPGDRCRSTRDGVRRHAAGGGSPGAPAARSSAGMRCAIVRGDRRALRRASRRCACGTSATSSAAATGRATATSPPSAFRRWLRRRYGDDGGAQRGVGHRLLGAAVQRLRRRSCRPRAAQHRGQPRLAAGLRTASPPTRCSATTSPSGDVLRRGDARDPASPRTSWSAAAGRVGLRAVGAEMDIVANDHYTIAAEPRRHGRSGLQRRSHARHRRRAPVAADGALGERRELAAGATAPRGRARCTATRSRTSPAAPTARCSSSGGSRSPAPSSSTPRWCRTPDPTRRVFREVVGLGETLALAEVRGTPVERAQVALLFDDEAAAGRRAGPQPVELLDATRRCLTPCTARSPAEACRRRRASMDRSRRVRAGARPRLYLSRTTPAGWRRSARRRAGRRQLLLGHRRRVQPRAPRWLSRRVPGPARRARRGVPPLLEGAGRARRRFGASALDRGVWATARPCGSFAAGDAHRHARGHAA